jgi:transposase, IS30 family
MGRPSLPGGQRREFWRLIRAGATQEEAAAGSGVSGTSAGRIFSQAGGVCPVDVEQTRSSRYLSLAEREQISVGLAEGKTPAQIARELSRARSTISREIARNSCTYHRNSYRAIAAQYKAEIRARRPKPTKLARHGLLCREVQHRLREDHSPEQIAARLRWEFPDQPEMQVSHETIYKSLYVQARGELSRELTRHLRTGRRLRRPRRRAEQRRGRIKDMVPISARPAEASDRAVPGHWEGDLIMGSRSESAIGTLVERTTRFTMLLHLPKGHDAPQVRDAMVAQITTLPEQLRRSLAWDQGKEMACHGAITIACNLPVFFCDPHSPWQRGSNENTNGLLRQYFPKGTDLSTHSAEHLAAVAAKLNSRPRKTLNWQTPAERLDALLQAPTPA